MKNKIGKMRTFPLRVTGLAAVIAVFTFLLFIAGCGGGESGPNPAAVDVKFPEFVYRSESALDGYKIAVAYAEILQNIPCYCGCKRDAEKYQSLKDCFINRQTGEYDEHAAGCEICLEEARDIEQWKKEGLSTKEIRQRIDEKFADRGEPTDTPMPAE